MPSSPADITSNVQASYDKIADAYTAWVESRPSPRLRYIDRLLSYLRSKSSTAKILELGCGAGVPVTAYLAERVEEVVANDISTRQLERARERVSSTRVSFVGGSMLDLNFEPESYDGVVAFFSLFHLPLPDQRNMLHQIQEWLKPGGIMVCNFGAAPDSKIMPNQEGVTDNVETTEDSASHWNDFFGAQMFWANMGAEGSLEMLKHAEFEVLESEILDGTDHEEHAKGGDPDAGVKFLWIVARKAN